MRLKTIKLAGFKSFVDPTSVNLPSNMCAVVGPNGCGKSNIIDAVRWVMGESSAKNLRGEAMTDVIFNGSGSRKPVGQASIELVFDNSDGTITGEYAGYAEISVKRRVTRDGQNLYYLNNNRCRRRDITDIFLGTGLGPRSYAIIEQGMISRLIEAKPEELRVYIEEAAGISKYKERRKDTENRMRRTQENLERLTDIREELERQLSRLERQAKAAEKYGIFKAEERSLNAKLRAIRFQNLKTSADQISQIITEAELSVESVVTQRVKFDSEIEKHRADFTEKSDHFNEIQGQFYSLGADIARIEQNIKHSQERERTLRVDLEQTERDLKESQEHLGLDQAKIEGWEAELLEISPELEILAEGMDSAHAELQTAEEQMQTWQQSWDAFNSRAAEPKQAAEVQQSRIQYLDQVQQRLLKRKEKVLSEISTFEIGDEKDEIAIEEEHLSELDLEIETLSETISTSGEKITEVREALDGLSSEKADLQTSLQKNKGRLASLEALQAAAMGDDSAGMSDWIQQNGLDADLRLADQIQVSDGWEQAAEVVLGKSLQAYFSSKPLNSFLDMLDSLPSTLELMAGGQSVGSSDGLAGHIQSEADLSQFLAGIHTAENLTDAKRILPTLSAGESVVTKDGIWLSNTWLRVTKQSDSEAGLLARKKEIEILTSEIAEQEQQLENINQQLDNKRESLKQTESEREAARKQQEQMQRTANQLRGEIASKKSKIEQLLLQQEKSKTDIQEVEEQLALEAENLSEARALLEEAIVAMESDSEEREKLLAQRDELRSKLDSNRQQARQAQDRNHELAMRQRSIQTQMDSMRQSVQRLNDQLKRMQERREQLRTTLEETSTPGEDHQIELEALLEKRVSVEHKLGESRRSMEDTEQGLRNAEKARDEAEKSISEQRGKLESSRLELQTVQVQAQTIQQQLEEDEFDLQTVLNELTEEDSVSELENAIAELSVKISRLGPINLAAIDEYKTESERKLYLDEQNDDLCEALETLEGAIRKIDKETRTRFKETYDQVNSGLQNLFPRLFGGGHAYLELTGEDMLDTGIAIMARPPGKKNSTIHLLSGGEKALTAIALVFAIFQLNPAPFCMLDEVDAPLDDANVGRYANIVEAMSEQVQFIYITHNKIAMEKAHHLMGVTMQEAGVSRMVTVDVEEAAELAAI